MPNGEKHSPLTASKDLLASLRSIDKLDVFMHGTHVGTLAATPDGGTAFQYDDEWIGSGFSISPLSLPLGDQVFIANNDNQLDGLFGIFDDSLPDGWGRLLVDRFLREQGIDPFEITPIARLAIVGSAGMGALEYRPAVDVPRKANELSFDDLARECASLLADEGLTGLDELFAMGGSSGGARPKVLTKIDGEDWIVKFPSSIDARGIGAQEFAIAKAAERAGIEMPEVRLMPSDMCEGYFATKRFDRIREAGMEAPAKAHMASAAALLETSHRIPNLDYRDLMKLALLMTDDMGQLEALLRLMAFNVFIGNRDDHSKNFSFLRDGRIESGWRLSPAYDLTSNPGMNGEHFTTVNGKGKGITVLDMMEVGERAGIRTPTVRSIIEDVSDVVRTELTDIIDLPSISYR